MGDRSARFPLSFLAVVLLALSTLVAAPLPRPATVGFFAMRLAQNLGYEVKTPPEARELLSAAGVTFAGALDATLTEKEAARVLGDLGLAATGNTDRILSEPLAQAAAGLAARGVLAGGGGPSPKGSVPASCQSLQRDQCFQCCIDSLGRIAIVPQRMIDLCNSSCTTLGATSPSAP